MQATGRGGTCLGRAAGVHGAYWMLALALGPVAAVVFVGSAYDEAIGLDRHDVVPGEQGVRRDFIGLATAAPTQAHAQTPRAD